MLIKNIKIVLAILIAGGSSVLAGQKQFQVGAGEMRVFGWPAASATVSSIFANQTIPDLTMVQIWDEVNQSWISATFDGIDGDWNFPNATVQSGRGFFLTNPQITGSPHTYTFNYTPRPTGTMDITLTLGKWYFLSYAWEVTSDITIALEDLPPPHPHYAGPHLDWPGGCCGDTIQKWIMDLGWTFRSRSDDCPTERRWLQSINDFSPPMTDFWQEPFWFKNECVTRTWTHRSTVLDSRYP